jgi:hypothetical protein
LSRRGFAERWSLISKLLERRCPRPLTASTSIVRGGISRLRGFGDTPPHVVVLLCADMRPTLGKRIAA